MRRFALDQLPVTPWRNGGGKTREIGQGRIGPASAGASPDGWDWRLSVASISGDGAFSTFDGVDRTAVLVGGAVTLTSATQVLSWTAVGELHSFAGEIAFGARLAQGPARFFNVMVKRKYSIAKVITHNGSFSLSIPTAEKICFLVAQGRFQFANFEGEQILETDEGLLFPGSQAASEVKLLSNSGCLIEVQLIRRLLISTQT